MIKFVKKRDKSFVSFDYDKIVKAVDKAIKASPENVKYNSEFLTEQVKLQLIKNYPDTDTVDIEDIQDEVVKTIWQYSHKLSLVYNNYRVDKASERKYFEKRFTKIIESYLDNSDWKIKENSNTAKSIQGLNLRLSGIGSKSYWLNNVYNKEGAEAHKRGNIHIHDLYLLGAYCCGFDLKNLLHQGFTGCPGKTSCLPPNHFQAACGQIYNFMYTIAGEIAGAVALSNVDTLLAPYIRKDNLDDDQLNQIMQNLIYNLNVPTRTGFQCLSEDTEILTETGWKTYDLLEMDDVIVTLNLESREYENLLIEGLNIYNHTGKMINIKTENTDQLVTTTHNCVVTNDSTTYILEPALDVFNSKYITNYKFPSIILDPVVDTVISNRIDELVTEIGTVVNYNGIVWCPTTRNNTVIARRNGKAFITGNSPFSNFTLDLECPTFMKSEPVYIAGKEYGNYGDYQHEMDRFNNTFSKIMMGGDKDKKIFTFPIPTYGIDENFNWDNSGLDYFWEMTAKFGVPYFANYINTDMSKDDTLSMCPLGAKELVLQKVEGISSLTEIKSLAGKECKLYSDGYWQTGKVTEYPNQTMLNIKLFTGQQISVSQNHKQMYKSDSKAKTLTVPAMILRPGDYLPFAKPQTTTIGNFEIEAYISGIFAACGKITNGDLFLSKPETVENDEAFNEVKSLFQHSDCYIYYNRDTKIPTVTLKIINPDQKILYYLDYINAYYPSDYLLSASVNCKKAWLCGYSKFNDNTIPGYDKRMTDLLNILCTMIGSLRYENKLICDTKNETDDWFFDERYWGKIKSIELGEVETAYCFAVDSGDEVFTIGTSGILTHNCRLKIDKSQLKKRGGGLFGAGSQTGSVGVITINLPRIGHLAIDKEDYFNRLEILVKQCKDLLIEKQEFVEAQTENNMYPYTKFFLQSTKDRLGKYWENHFLTVGIIGMNECCENFLNEDITSTAGKQLADDTMDFINNLLLKYQEDTGRLFNLEASPAEGSSYSLWLTDKKKYPSMRCFKKSDNIFYTNSTQLPTTNKLDIFSALSHQESLQKKYTGGSVFHIHLGERITANMAKSLVKKALNNYEIPYFSLTPVFSICEKHGYINGEVLICPACGADVLTYSRVIGYYRSTKNFNIGKLDEFKKRHLFNINEKILS